MKKFITLILCFLYTFVTFGGSVFVHHCGENSQLSIYEKYSHGSCPLCSHSKLADTKTDGCKSGNCKDIEIKINQLSDKLFSAKKSEKFNLEPIILQRFWIELLSFNFQTPTTTIVESFLLKNTESSPPSYILNCNFRN